MFTVEISKVMSWSDKDSVYVILRNSNLPSVSQKWVFTPGEANSLIGGLKAALHFIEQGPDFPPWEVKE